MDDPTRERAAMLLQQAAELGPGPGAATLKREAAELLMDEDLAQAMSLLAEALEEDPGDRGELLEALATQGGRWDLLIEVCERRVERASEPGARIEVLERLAVLHEDLLGDVERALACHRRVLELDPGHALAQRELERLRLVEAPAGRVPRVDQETMDRRTAGSPFRGFVPGPVKPPVESAPSPAPAPAPVPAAARGPRGNLAWFVAVALLFAGVLIALLVTR